jgi:signal recognition particle subunit SRP54
MISSMTPRERRNPDLLNASRKRRIAAGSGVQVHELNRLLKQHMEMARMLKKLKGMDPSKLKRGGMGKLFS